jgi:hypothetical protein
MYYRGEFLVPFQSLPRKQSAPVIERCAAPRRALVLVAPELAEGILSRLAVLRRWLAHNKVRNLVPIDRSDSEPRHLTWPPCR